MNDATQLLRAIEDGDPQAAKDLLPLVYDQLRELAAAKMAREQPGHTLQPTALVHEAYIRLVGKTDPQWNSRGHFFGAAAEAMRRILVENARRKNRRRERDQELALNLQTLRVASIANDDQILALNEALETLEARDPVKAQLVKLRFFTGLKNEEAAEIMGLSVTTIKRHWTYLKSWLYTQLRPASDSATHQLDTEKSVLRKN